MDASVSKIDEEWCECAQCAWWRVNGEQSVDKIARKTDATDEKLRGLSCYFSGFASFKSCSVLRCTVRMALTSHSSIFWHVCLCICDCKPSRAVCQHESASNAYYYYVSAMVVVIFLHYLLLSPSDVCTTS
jgi:hypothetical protein